MEDDDCPVCLDPLVSQKSVILHCDHVVHFECAVKILNGSSIGCHDCKKTTTVSGGLEKLKTWNVMKKQPSTSTQEKLLPCEHPYMNLEYYCDTCGHSICEICYEEEHESHIVRKQALDISHYSIPTAQKESLKYVNAQLQKWKGDAQQAMNYYSEQKKILKDRCQDVKKKFTDDFRSLRSMLEEIELQNQQRVDMFMMEKNNEFEEYETNVKKFMKKIQALESDVNSMSEAKLSQAHRELTKEIENSKTLKDEPVLISVDYNCDNDSFAKALEKCVTLDFNVVSQETWNLQLLQPIELSVEKNVARYPEEEKTIQDLGICEDISRIRTVLNAFDGDVDQAINALLR